MSLALPTDVFFGVLFPQIVVFLSISFLSYMWIFTKIRLRIKERRRSLTLSRHVTLMTLRRTSREEKMALTASKTTGAILMTLMVCWVPFCILTTVINLDTFLTDYFSFVGYELSIYLLYTDSIANAFLLYWGSRDYRNAYRMTFKWMCLRSR